MNATALHTPMPGAPDASDAPVPPARARRVQALSLLAVAPLLAVLLYRLRGVFRAEVAAALPDATRQEIALGTWAAVATGTLLNILAYVGAVLVIGAVGAALCRWLGFTPELRRLRHLIGAVLAAYLLLRTAVLVILSVTPVADRTLLSWLPSPDPSLLLLALGTWFVLYRTASQVGALRIAVCAFAPAALLALAQIVV